ncbi:MAG TPA: hypothetical protein VK551_06360 [Thermodesulfobacteriota bacterium]|jgi:hypothetical protein|nr:hypothetical protein [Thermodesulfobacteriota bacterium]
MDVESLWSLEYLIGQWRPTIGDPDFMGWFTVGSYFVCAILSLIAAFGNRIVDRRAASFWRMVGVLMILLGINKQLDLQSLFTEIGRQIARAQGWMDQRRIVQFWFIVAFGTAVFASFFLFVRIKRDLFGRFKLAFIGLFFLFSFIVIRAVSFHHFEEMLGFRLFGAKMNWLFELTGIYLISIAGLQEFIWLWKILF